MIKLLITMGVSGAGKSTIAAALAEHYGYRYLDADDFHSDEAKAHMGSGQPLTDEMRVPWIERICDYLGRHADTEQGMVLAFSGLRRAHRERLRRCGIPAQFLFLDGDAETISRRMSEREGHFMPPTLLDSQFEALERPDPGEEPDVSVIDIRPSVPGVLERTISEVDRKLAECGCL